MTADELWDHLKVNFADHKDPKSNKLSHYIWQRYASSVWDDIRIDNVLPFRDSREDDDEKHVHPLQLDVIDRIVELYSNPGETVLTPFMGVGSEVYSPVSMGRKAIGIELKESYFKQAKINLGYASSRFDQEDNGGEQGSLL
jgi:DNA modification methylase